jgi:hypothetical protein
MGIGDLNLDELDFTDTEGIKAALSEGQTAYREVGKLRNKNGEVLGEKKAVQAQYETLRTKLSSKGVDIDRIDDLDLNATTDETLKKYQKQLEDERTTFNSRNSELTTKLDSATKERESLVAQIEQAKVKAQYSTAAKTAGVDADFIDDYYLILQARGVQMYIDPESGEARGKRSIDVVDYSLGTLISNFKADPTHQRYFAGKFGGGSGTSANGGKSGDANPFHPDTFNLTKQSEIYRLDPNRAAELQRLAGV